MIYTLHSKNTSCHEAVLINRLRNDRSCLTHSRLMSDDDAPACGWNVPTCRNIVTNTSLVSSLRDLLKAQSYYYGFYQGN